jgi:hypothetical protein
MTSMPEPQEPNRLRIKQQNCKHSKTVTDTLISDTNPDDWDIILLQEPYIYPNTHITVTSPKWFTIYPRANPTNPPKTATLISSKFPSNAFEQLSIPSELITAISLRLGAETLQVYNIYNPLTSDLAVVQLHDWIQAEPPPQDSGMIWAGNFNKHSPLWTSDEHLHRCRTSDTDLLLSVLAEHHMSLSLPPGTLTYESEQHINVWSTLDLVFCSPEIHGRIISCDSDHDDHIPGADHLPVHTVINTSTPTIQRLPGRNYRDTPWEKFESSLARRLSQLRSWDADTITSPDDLDRQVQLLTEAIQATIEEHILRRQITPYSKRWWTPELKMLRKEYAKADRAHFHTKDTEREEELREKRNRARNLYTATLRRAKASHWKSWLEEIDERDIWTAGRMAKNPLSSTNRALIPTLTTTSPSGELQVHNTDETKAQVFRHIFFLPKPTALPPAPGDDESFPDPLPFTPPHPHQVTKCLLALRPFKAPGNDGIPNVVLRQNTVILTPYLHQCLLVSLRLKYFPKAWREWTTVVLKKPGRPDYTIPKAYRPIALYNTMGKVLSGVITDVTVYLTVRHSLLPQRHFGGLPGRTTTDSLLYLTHKIKDAWRRKKVVTIIFLDIANAFPNAVTDRLLLNMKRLGYPTAIIQFYEALLKDRKTKLSFDDYVSELIDIDNGIGQGEPGSMILYLIYNYGLISIPQGPQENGGGYVDDTFFMAIADTFEECDQILNGMLDKQERWSRSHNSNAEISKFQCLRLTRKKNIERADFHRTTGQTIACVKTAKLLGVQLDQELRWHPQVTQAVKNGTNLLHAICRLTRPSFGLPYRYARRLFLSMVLPKMEYALPVWYTPIHTDERTGRRKGSIGHTKELAKVQRLGCKLLTGAFRCMATDVLDIHAFLPPIELRLSSSCFNESLRLVAVPNLHPLFRMVKSSARRQPKSHPSPLHSLFEAFPINPSDIETIDPVRQHPNWQPNFTTFIGRDRGEATQHVTRRIDEIQVFTDGSGYAESIGAAAVIPGTDHTLKYRAGSDDRHTVFEGELIGILLALQFPSHFPAATSLFIALDNQAAIKALINNNPQPGQRILDEIHRTIALLKK